MAVSSNRSPQFLCANRRPLEAAAQAGEQIELYLKLFAATRVLPGIQRTGETDRNRTDLRHRRLPVERQRLRRQSLTDFSRIHQLEGGDEAASLAVREE
jgi:hypothetical protein